jgi:GAF domain-containing protein
MWRLVKLVDDICLTLSKIETLHFFVVKYTSAAASFDSIFETAWVVFYTDPNILFLLNCSIQREDFKPIVQKTSCWIRICTFAAMSENLVISQEADKTLRYEVLLPQLEALIDPEVGAVANVGNLIAAMRQTFDWWWIGVYMVQNNMLELGPFQGPIACTRIASGKGVCGSAWASASTILVPNVDEFPGHIACSSASKSEIVVPIWHESEVIGVLDVDSQYLNHFDATDQHHLEIVARLISKCYAL